VPRSSRAQTARHHEELIAAASQLIRERGVGSVSLPEITGKIGLTRGAFYKHFESREALVATAIEACYREQLDNFARLAAEHPDDPEAQRAAMLDWYLSPEHRDDPGSGCPTALAQAISQSEPGSPLRTAYIDGLYKILAANGVDPEHLGTDPDERQREILTQLITLAGGLMMARATAGDPLSDIILSTVRASLG
jgi:TetR/AcrR family transcriptional repressor of nem operon